MLVGRPVLSGILSAICPLASSNTMMESGYAPTKSVAPGAALGRSVNSTSTARNVFIRLWEDDVEITPVLGSGGALAGPTWRIVEMVRHLCRPETGDVAIIDVSLHRLAESCGTARRIHFPARRKRKRAAHRYVRLRRRGLRWILQCDHIFIGPRDFGCYATGLMVQRSQVLHDGTFLSAKNLRNSGL